MAGVKVGNLDIQFGPDFDQQKANQLVQALQQVIGAVRQLSQTAGSTSTPTTPTTQVLATQAGLGSQLTVEGLQAGQVLVAETPTTAHFAFLQFAQMAQTDAATFAAPANGSVIAFVNGYWSAEANSFGLANPGSDAVILWDTTANGGAGGLTWALQGLGIQLMSGRIAVDATQLTHGLLRGLLADDHPQYELVGMAAQLALANVFALLQTFQSGLVSGSDIDLTGNLEQTGIEGVEDRIQNTNDVTDEGTWRLHVEPGQLMFASVADLDPNYPIGSDGEEWLTITRIAEIVDQVNVQANSLTFNGFDVMQADPTPGSPFFDVVAGGIRYRLLTTAVVVGGTPGSGTVTSVALSTSSGFLTLSGTNPVTGSGTIGVDITPSALAALMTTEALAASALQNPTRQTANLTTASNVQVTGNLTLAKGFRVLLISCTSAARLRLYATVALRNADVARAVGTYPSTTSGLIGEWVFDGATVTSIICSPVVQGANMESSPTSSIAYTIDPPTTGSTAFTLQYEVIES